MRLGYVLSWYLGLVCDKLFIIIIIIGLSQLQLINHRNFPTIKFTLSLNIYTPFLL